MCVVYGVHVPTCELVVWRNHCHLYNTPSSKNQLASRRVIRCKFFLSVRSLSRCRCVLYAGTIFEHVKCFWHGKLCKKPRTSTRVGESKRSRCALISLQCHQHLLILTLHTLACAKDFYLLIFPNISPTRPFKLIAQQIDYFLRNRLYRRETYSCYSIFQFMLKGNVPCVNTPCGLTWNHGIRYVCGVCWTLGVTSKACDIYE